MIINRPRVSLACVYVTLLVLGFIGCGSDSEGDSAANGGSGNGPGGATSGAGTSASASGAAGSSGRGGGTGSGSGGSQSLDPDAGDAGSGATLPGDAGPPPATPSGDSVYTLECRGDSRDCNAASVPCFGLLAGVDAGAIGYACANRCNSVADCSSAPTGAEAEVDCVQLTAAKHCLLVCKFETQEFACPDGMGCYVYQGSPIGYCLWM